MTQSITEILQGAVDKINQDLPDDMKLGFSPETPLMGAGRRIDSLGIVMLITELERSISESFGIELTIGGEETDTTDNPFQSLGALQSYLTREVTKIDPAANVGDDR